MFVVSVPMVSSETKQYVPSMCLVSERAGEQQFPATRRLERRILVFSVPPAVHDNGEKHTYTNDAQLGKRIWWDTVENNYPNYKKKEKAKYSLLLIRKAG